MTAISYALHKQADYTVVEGMPPILAKEERVAQEEGTGTEYLSRILHEWTGDVRGMQPEIRSELESLIVVPTLDTALLEYLRERPVEPVIEGTISTAYVTPKKYGVPILAALTLSAVLLFIGMFITVTSPYYIVKPRSAAFGIAVVLFLILETLVGIVLRRGKKV